MHMFIWFPIKHLLCHLHTHSPTHIILLDLQRSLSLVCECVFLRHKQLLLMMFYFMMKCVCVCTSFWGADSHGWPGVWLPGLRRNCGDREREIKDRMSFTAISLIDRIDIFNPPLFFLFVPFPLCLTLLFPVCLSSHQTFSPYCFFIR